MATTLTTAPTRRERLDSSATAAKDRRHHGDARLAFWFSGALTVVATIACVFGVVYPDIFRETAWTAGNAQGTALVILAVAIPTVIASMVLAARGSWRARIAWLGALSYILYNAVFFAYGIHFNSLFLLYTTMLGLAFWSVITLLHTVDVEELRAHVAPGMRARAYAAYLALVNIPFVLLWLKDIVPAILDNAAPAGLKGTGMITNPVQTTDFAFSFSLIALSVVWLWRRQTWGYLLAGAWLVYGVIEAISVGTDQFLGHLHDSGQSAGAVPVFAVFALVSLVPVVLFLRNVRPNASNDRLAPRTPDESPAAPRSPR